MTGMELRAPVQAAYSSAHGDKVGDDDEWTIAGQSLSDLVLKSTGGRTRGPMRCEPATGRIFQGLPMEIFIPRLNDLDGDKPGDDDEC